MAQDKAIVDSQIKALGNFSRFLVRSEIQFLPEILRQNEQLHALTSGRFKDHDNWLVVVTDQRILCLYKGIFFGMKQVELPMHQISGIGHQTGMMFGEIVATTSGGSEALTMIPKSDVVMVAAALSELVHARASGTQVERKAANGAVVTNTVSPALHIVDSPTPTSTKPKISPGKAFQLLISMGLILFGFFGMFKNFGSGVKLMVVGFLLAPSLAKAFQRVFKINLNKYIQFAFAVIVLVFFASTIPSNAENRGLPVKDFTVDAKPLQQDSSKLSSLDKKYLAGLHEYQGKQNELGATVAKSMSGLETGETTLADVSDVINTAYTENEVAFELNYVSPDKVPPMFASIDKKVRKSYELRIASYKAYLKNLKEMKPEKIPSIQRVFMQSEKIAQEATNESIEVLKMVSK